MTPFVLYLLLLKAVMASFSGFSSLPVLRNDLVVQRHVLTDRQLNTAIAVARLGPGPYGLYVVCVGYYVAGVPGAGAGFLAMITPAFLIILFLKQLGRWAQQEHIRRMIRAVTLGAVGLLLASMLPLARDALVSSISIAIAVSSFLVLVFTKVDTFWVAVGAAAAGVMVHLLATGMLIY